MSSTTSTTLDTHFKKQKPALTHLEYLDSILKNISPVHMSKVMEIRNTIELTLLDNPKSKNKVVAYLSWVNTSLQAIWRQRWKLLKQEVSLVASR